MRRLLAAVPLLIACCIPAGAADAAKRHSCSPAGSRTVVSDRLGRVYVVSPDAQPAYYGCLYRIGRRTALESNADDIGRIKMAGRYVAYSWDVASSQGSATVLERIDLRSGRRVELDSLLTGRYTSEQVRRFLVTSFGAVVWARYADDDPLPTGEIRKIDAEGRETLDSGMDIHAHTLRLSRTGHRVYWRNAGEQKSARLR